MGASGAVPLDETLGNRSTLGRTQDRGDTGHRLRCELIVVAVAAAVFLGCIVSPPSLMDDVDAVQAQIARNMFDSGDWVTARLDGIAYLEKSPLKYWLIAVSYKVFGVHDWVARLPVALSAVVLCWLAFRIGAWAFSVRAGMYAGLALATCVGLFLFTRIQIPDVTITATIALAMWSFLRALDSEEPRPGVWATVMAASIGTGLLLKGLIAALFPIAAALLYLAFTRQIGSRETWRRLHPFRGALVALAIAAPWHVLATLRNPPYFDFTMHSGPGEYRGFFWFYFMNEHVLRFLNLRYPRDYNTVPRVYFWLFHLLWLFPWSVYFPAVATLSFRPVAGMDRARKMRLLCLCWAGFLLTFFTFSSTQEYYSMPCYPALALLVGQAIAFCGLSGVRINWIKLGNIALTVVASLAALTIAWILTQVWNLPAPGDISRALTQHPEAYTLSLGHVGDLTMASFAYLRGPLMLAGLACVIGALTVSRGKLAGAVIMMVLFVHAARQALVVFDPYLSSRPLAEALNHAPGGNLILDDQYYTFSSVVFYAEAYHGKRILLLNGRVNNLEYGSYAPHAPQDVFLNDAGFRERWLSPDLYYICVEQPQVDRLRKLVGSDALHTLVESGGKFVFANRPWVKARSMRVTIDATSALVRSAGVKNYTYYWIAHLRRQAARGDEIRAYPFLPDDFGQLDHEASVLPVWATIPRLAALHAVNLFGRRALDFVLRGTDTFHASNQVHHAPGRARLTATVHDLTAFFMPEVHTAGNVRADHIFAERILKRAHGLIAVSENTRQDTIRLLGIPPERITTIYSGVPEQFFNAAPIRRARPYVLYVGTIEPRKNLETFLDAWKQLKPSLREEFELIFAGPVGWSAETTIARIRAEATYVGYVPEADLPGLVAGALAFVYPSLYEGFGFPVVQAMAAGTPVITSNVSCLPEIAGDAALLVDPRSTAELAAALSRLLESGTLREELISRGRERARRYRWETCAEQSLQFFRKIGSLR